MRFLAVLAALVLPLVAYYPVYQEREKTIENADKQIRELEMRIEQGRARNLIADSGAKYYWRWREDWPPVRRRI